MLVNPDILENTIRCHSGLLEILLLDHTRSTAQKCHNILWATDSYKNHSPKSEIKLEDITGENTRLIQPRIMKSKDEQKRRSKDKAEVFTPKSIVDQMNKQVDWANSATWPVDINNWQTYVRELKLEITCGEAPFIVGRYNAATGKKVLELENRVGFLDRKMQQVDRFCHDKASFIEWSKAAFKASYGYEWQGDNLLIARENLLYTFMDYWNAKFADDEINLDCKISEEKFSLLKEFAKIISWNIFQMDGLKYVIPMSCQHEIIEDDVPPMLAILGEKGTVIKHECPGCKKNEPFSHNGKYVRIMDWEANKAVKFINLLKSNSK